MEITHYTIWWCSKRRRRAKMMTRVSRVLNKTPASLLPGRAGEPTTPPPAWAFRKRYCGRQVVAGRRRRRCCCYVGTRWAPKGGPGRRGKGYLPIIHTHHSRHSHWLYRYVKYNTIIKTSVARRPQSPPAWRPTQVVVGGGGRPRLRDAFRR